MALHELFRAEIVKATPRPMLAHGEELPLHTQTIEHLDVDAV